MRLRPDDPDPYYGLGQTLKAAGDVPGAIDAFKKYIAMEKRPEEQRWVDKAKAELQALQSMQKGSRRETRGSSMMRAANDELDRELQRDAVLPMSSGDDLIDPFRATGSVSAKVTLRNPFPVDDDELINPYAEPQAPARVDARRLREYGAALLAYRRALSAQAEDLSERYERGLASLNDTPTALRMWNSVKLDDPRVVEARRSIERVRALIARR
jgi:tetratricopeptide (TPR) repeat protein